MEWKGVGQWRRDLEVGRKSRGEEDDVETFSINTNSRTTNRWATLVVRLVTRENFRVPLTAAVLSVVEKL
jgi:hypothetical protein